MKITSALLLLLIPVFAHAAPANWQYKIAPEVLAVAAAEGEADFIIEMAEQADLSGASLFRIKADKTRFTFETLRTLARRTQPPVLARLRALGAPAQPFWIANAIASRGGVALLSAIAQMPQVAAVHGVGGIQHIGPVSRSAAPAKAEGEVEPGIALVRANQVWKKGFLGQGVVVADHDIGVLWDHEALKANYRGWDGTTADHAYNWHNAFVQDPLCPDLDVPCDPHGHGTHTTGTMVGDAGEGNRIGMAPRAQWIACRSLFDSVVGVGFLPTYMECMEWTIAPYPQRDTASADPARAPDVVNNSWGCLEGCPPTILQATNEAVKAAGIVQVVSAGNDGAECMTIAFPLGIYDSSFTVGATDFSDQMASFSSRGPVVSDLSMRIKPNVVAPGVGVRSSVETGGYSEFSGTSMSGPHVAGLVALMFSAAPDLKGDVDAVREIIQQTAVPITSGETCGGTSDSDIPNNTFGYGRIDALAAVEAAIKATQPQPPKVADKASGTGLLLGAFGLLPLLMLAVAGVLRARCRLV